MPLSVYRLCNLSLSYGFLPVSQVMAKTVLKFGHFITSHNHVFTSLAASSTEPNTPASKHMSYLHTMCESQAVFLNKSRLWFQDSSGAKDLSVLKVEVCGLLQSGLDFDQIIILSQALGKKPFWLQSITSSYSLPFPQMILCKMQSELRLGKSSAQQLCIKAQNSKPKKVARIYTSSHLVLI